MITDERLRAAAEKSSDLYLCCMEEGYDAIPPHEFSEPFERKIRKLKKRADHPYFYKMMHKVAVIILAVLIGGSAWLAVDTEARASFLDGSKRCTKSCLYIILRMGVPAMKERITTI